MIREKLTVILKDKFKDGATFDLLRDGLYKDKSLLATSPIEISSKKESMILREFKKINVEFTIG